MIYNPRKRSRACNGSVGLRARNHVKSDLDTFYFYQPHRLSKVCVA